MYWGWTSLCLPATDLDRSARFYEAIGMERVEKVPSVRIVLGNGGFRLALMPFLEGPLLNVRGADVPRACAAATERSPDHSGRAESYEPDDANRASAAGTSWLTHDPAGIPVLFDTNRNEEGDRFRRARARQILLDAENELERLGASERMRRELRALIDADV